MSAQWCKISWLIIDTVLHYPKFLIRNIHPQ